MRATLLKRAWRTFGHAHFAPQSRGGIVMVALLLAAANLSAAPIVNWVSGGPNIGLPSGAAYVDGDTILDAEYHTPCGIAMNSSGNYLFVADRDNNAIRYLDLDANWTWTFVIAAPSLIRNPIAVALDSSDNVYVLNRGTTNNISTTGTVVEFNNWGDLVIKNATGLINAAGMALDGVGNIYLTVQSNKLIRIAAGTTNRTTIATIPNAGASLQGIVVKHNGLIAACDSGRNGIYLIDPATGIVTTNAGFHGRGDFNINGNNIASSSTAQFNQPMNVAETGDGNLIVTDFGNHRVKVVTSTSVTNLYGVSSNNWVYIRNSPYYNWPGFVDGTVVVPDAPGGVAARQPFGVAIAPDGNVYVTEDYYHIIRHVTAGFVPPVRPPHPPTELTATANSGQVILTWTASPGATNYTIKRSTSSGGPYTTIGSTTATSYTDTNVINGMTYYYVVLASNAGGESANSLEVSATPPLPPVPDPQIGYVDFPATASPPYTSVFHPVSSYDFYNDATIVINGTPGSGTYYTYGYTTNTSLVPNPTPASASVLSDYQDGLFPGQLPPYTIAQVAPYLTIKAMGAKGDGSPNSAVVQATFQFKTGNPNIIGNNAAHFTISDITANAHLYYTLDGSDPSSTNANAVDLGTVPTPTNVWTVSLSIQTNTWFKVRAFRNNYQPSAIVTNLFAITNFLANTISFGFAAGEASSDFVGAPGQTFYAPVTLTTLPGTVIYSLQFNITVTNLNSAPQVALGAFGFQSMLEKPIIGSTLYYIHGTTVITTNPVVIINGIAVANDPIPGTTLYQKIPPLSFSQYQINPPPPSAIVYYDGLPFVNMMFTNTANNLLGIGWLERYSFNYLYETVSQDLITYSQAHDTLFPNAANPGKVIVGGYAFQVPATAQPGDSYRIQLGRPSATSDGIGAPGSDVYIATPTNGSLTAGVVNSIKIVTAGQRKYIAGDSAPFRWFNAGDFGNTNLDNSDVMQVFESAIYNFNNPPTNSDFFDSMDSCGVTYIDNGNGYLEQNTLVSNPNLLFNGNDTTINQIAFGNTNLDVCDVYVTFRRSLDPSLTWFRRYWSGGFRVAEIVPNVVPHALIEPSATVQSKVNASPASTNSPQVNFSASNFLASAGQTIQVPITAQIFGAYPLRVLMLNLTVVPLDGSPALTTPVQFNQTAPLGAPYTTDSKGNGNYSAVWLNSTIAGLTGTVTLGTLTVTIPASATSQSAYAIHFDHASASPNGIASFPKQTLTGLITLSNRSGSSYNDGIPDSWRLRYFLTLNNFLSQTNADADGDGLNNLQESLAGTDPTDPKSFFKNIGTDPGAAQQPNDCVISWPSASGKQYVIERSPSLASPIWIPVSTNSGTGTIMQFHDSAGGGVRFYRVRVQ